MAETCQPTTNLSEICLRGTVGCASAHDEVTLLERLDHAEAALIQAMALPVLPPDLEPWDDAVMLTHEWKTARAATINAASARCMAAAARCVAATEELPE